MKRLLFIVLSFMITQFVTGQGADQLYKKADSLYRRKDYKAAAGYYQQGIALQSKNAAMRRYMAALRSWALSNTPDSVFLLLDMIAGADNVYKAELRQIEYGPEYTGLQTDKRWAPALEKIRTQTGKNGYAQDEFIYGRKDGIGLTLVRIKPKVKSNGKAIISVRSGNWISSYNGIEVNPYGIDQYLARGFTVFAVFHGSQPRYAIPDEIEDLKRAVRYIRYHANLFGIDPGHIGITGNSSGGHLSLAVATADDKINPAAPDPVDRVSSRIQAIAVLFPPTDLINWDGKGMSAVNAFPLQKMAQVFGALDFRTFNDKEFTYEQVTDTIVRSKIGKEISPYYAVTADDPPVFIIHGDADMTVPVLHSESIISRFKEAGVPNRLVIKKGATHNAEQMNPEWQQFADWFEQYLK